MPLPDLKKIFHALPGFFIIVDSDKKIIDINFEYLTYLNKKEGDLKGVSLFTLFSGIREEINPLLDQVSVQNLIKKIRIKTEAEVENEFTLIPVPDGHCTFVLIKVEKLVANVVSEISNSQELYTYQRVIEQASDAIFIADAAGKYLDVNPAGCEMLDYSKAELLSLSVNDVLMPEELATPPRFGELMKGETILSTRNFRRKDGEMLPVEINARMLSNGMFLGMVRDISERKKIEEERKQLNLQLESMVAERTKDLELKIQELKESEEKFEKAFHASSVGITLTRLSDGVYIDVNDAFLQMIGYTKEEVINHSSVELNLVMNMKRRESVLQEIKEKGSVKHVELTVKKKSGGQVEILTSIETIIHKGEKYAINIIYDITDRKAAENKLQAVNKELEAFSYSVSHDLRAPLRSIVGFAELLNEDFGEDLNDIARRYIGTIKNNGIRMTRLIDDLLEFSRIGKHELAKQKIPTRAVVDKVISEVIADAVDSPQFKIDVLSDTYADYAMLNQVWFNLVSNAVKYSSKKSAPVIEIGSYPNGNETIFYIKDNGTGFNMDYAPKLFGVFQRLHRTNEFEGTGVGLALVKRIIDKHNGRVWAQGKENEGATFFFSLPAIKH